MGSGRLNYQTEQEQMLHSLLSDLDWFRQNYDETSYPTSNVLAYLLQVEIKDLMK